MGGIFHLHPAARNPDHLESTVIGSLKSPPCDKYTSLPVRAVRTADEEKS